MSKVAMCRDCNVPLVMTFAFRAAEFYCLECGRTYGFFGPSPADETPELLGDMRAREAEWEEHAGRHLLTVGARRTDCSTCSTNGEDHVAHATDEERAADKAARAWMRERRSS